MAEAANIDAYFERIGFAGSIAPSLETLSLLHQLHPAAIPFENLDPLMGAPVRLELSNLQQKLLFDRRGGYCLEHNLLLKAMLESLDFTVKAHGARVLWNREPGGEPLPPSHVVLSVDVAGVPYLADVGFGVATPTAPLRFRDGLEQATPHETFRLTGGPEWTLELRIEEDWRPAYRFDLAEIDAAGLTAMNGQVATNGHFDRNLSVSRAEKGRRLALSNLRLNTHATGGATETRMLKSVAELREVLAGPFGINLPPADRLDPVLQRIVDRETASPA